MTSATTVTKFDDAKKGTKVVDAAAVFAGRVGGKNSKSLARRRICDDRTMEDWHRREL